ncbi:MAG TPA: YceI family protein [Dehalococcoidia bacterium]|nr:YceI family protein [Dehalococcoidia bacterium]
MAWNVDTAHTQVAFAVRHLGISLIRGNFQLADAEVSLDEEHPERSSLKARIDVSTLDTRNPGRDGHLKTGDFFDVATYPYIEFATRAIRVRGGKFDVEGDLTIKGKTLPVTLNGEFAGPANDPVSGKRKFGFLLSGDLVQKDWGISWNVPMESGFMLADKVSLTIDAQAIEA